MIAILFLGNRNGDTTHIFFFSKVRLGLWTRIDFFFGKNSFSAKLSSGQVTNKSYFLQRYVSISLCLKDLMFLKQISCCNVLRILYTQYMYVAYSQITLVTEGWGKRIQLRKFSNNLGNYHICILHYQLQLEQSSKLLALLFYKKKENCFRNTVEKQ